jgi:c-di-GMP-binding flagellar brake protein YcgR
MAERREAARIRVNLPVRYSSRALSLDARAANLSRTGLFITSEYLDEIGETATITLDLPGEEDPIEVSGEVVRIDGDPGTCGMGIFFASLEQRDRRALANFMIQRSYSSV